MNLLDKLSFLHLLWFVPVLLAAHNAEEAPLMERWSRGLPLRVHPVVTTRQFVAAVSLLTVAGFLATYFGIRFPQPVGVLLILGIQMVMLVNALLPHLAATVGFRKYSPGVITGLLLNLPFSYYLFQRAMHEGYLSWHWFWILLAIAPFATVLLALGGLQFGKLFARHAQDPGSSVK